MRNNIIKKDLFKEYIELLLNEIYNINNDVDLSEYENCKDNTKLILMNNGCKFKDDFKIKNIINKDFNIDFTTIIGAFGNDINQYYDVINYCGITEIVIFLDYFRGLKESNDPILGKSIYFNAITKLIEIFLLSYYNPITMTGPTFNSTAAGNMLRWTPMLIAGYILERLVGLDENDIEGCGINYNYMMDTLNNNSIKEILMGIRTKE